MFRWLKKTFNKLLFGLNILISLCLLFSYLAAWIPPSNFYWLALLANGYPFLLLINLLFALFWLYRRKRYFYLSLVSIFLGGSHFFNLVGFNGSETSPSTDTVQVMSYNVRYFNATTLSNKKELEDAQQKILRTIEAQAIDIFCGQEFSGKTSAYNEISKQFLENKMGLKHHFQGGGSSLAIFSKYPILKKGTIGFPNSHNGAIYADLKYKENTIRVYCFHLQSIGLGSDEQELFAEENLSTLGQNATQKKYQRINNKLKEAFLLREEQANFIAQHIQTSPYPVLVCGDMNDTPNSYAYSQFAQKLTDAFREKGFGLGSTYAGLIPFLRIDYIFTSPGNQVEKFEVLPKTTSDHYPIYTHLRF